MSEPIAVLVPQINPNDEHAVVVRWHVAKGARVRAGQPLVTLETTKTTFDVDAPSDGYAFFDHEPNTGSPSARPSHGSPTTTGRCRCSAGARCRRDAGAGARRAVHAQGSQAHEGAGPERSRFPRRRQRRCRGRRARDGGRHEGARRRRAYHAGAVPLELSAVKDSGDSDAEARPRAGRPEHGRHGAPRRTS